MTFPPLNTSNDPFSINLFNHIRRIWLDSEIERRIENGLLKKTDLIRAVHIIICPKRKTEIRINEEVKLKANLLKKKGVAFEKGDPVFENQIIGIKDVTLMKDVDPNCANVILLNINEYYYIIFDFRYDLEHAQDVVSLARQFITSAEFALQNDQIGPFIDNLYSAAELSIKSIFLTWPHIEPGKKTTHQVIKKMYEEFGELGNVDKVFLDIFDELSSLRPRIRYFEPNYKLPKEDCERLINTVELIIQDSEKRIKRSGILSESSNNR